MDYASEAGFSGGNAAQINPEIPTMENWGPGLNDQAIWATEDDYGSNYDGSELPNKKPRSNSQGGDSVGSGFGRDVPSSANRSKVIGKMFFKTKLCCKFRTGTCPYITNCNFAHGIEELRKPPPNWQEIVAAQDEDRGLLSEPREEHQIPILTTSNNTGETQRSYKGRHCKKFYTKEGCPYGDTCAFLHDEQSKARESVAISLGPSMGNGYGTDANGSSQKPSNWKTRICNKWETSGYCPFGSKCHFSHGLGELHRYGGGLVDTEGREGSLAPPDLKQVVGVPSKTAMDCVLPSTTSVPHADVQRSSAVNQRPGQRPIHKWKGPDKISRIYGDWIYDYEMEPAL